MFCVQHADLIVGNSLCSIEGSEYAHLFALGNETVLREQVLINIANDYPTINGSDHNGLDTVYYGHLATISTNEERVRNM